MALLSLDMTIVDTRCTTKVEVAIQTSGPTTARNDMGPASLALMSSSSAWILTSMKQTYVLICDSGHHVLNAHTTASSLPRQQEVSARNSDNHPRQINRHLLAPSLLRVQNALTNFLSLSPCLRCFLFSQGNSRGFGFAQFASIEQAASFVDPVFPFIDLPPPASHGASARAAFNKALEAGQQHNGRRVKIDYSQSTTPAGRWGQSLNKNDGTRDIGNTQAPVLLFRGLDPLSGPQAIAQAMKLSSGPGKEGAKGMRRIILIKDKVTMASWGFAFVEFIDVAVCHSLHLL